MAGAGSQVLGFRGEQGADCGPAGTLRYLGDRGLVKFTSILPCSLWSGARAGAVGTDSGRSQQLVAGRTGSGGVWVRPGCLEPGETVREDPIWVWDGGIQRNCVGQY